MFLNPPPAKKIKSSKEMHVKKKTWIWSCQWVCSWLLKASPSCWCACTAAHPCQIQSHILKPHGFQRGWFGGVPSFRGETSLVGSDHPRFLCGEKKWKCRRLAEHFFGSTNLKVFCVFLVWKKPKPRGKGWERNDLEMKLLGFETSLQSQSDGILTPLMALKPFRPDPALQKILKISTFL